MLYCCSLYSIREKEENMRIEYLSKEMRFLINGGVGLLLAIVVFYYYNQYLGVERNYSLVIAFVVNEIFSFMMKKFWVFQNNSIKEATTQFILTLSFAVAYLQINNLAVDKLVNNLYLQKDDAQWLLVLIFIIPNFLLSKRIFRSQKTQSR